MWERRPQPSPVRRIISGAVSFMPEPRLFCVRGFPLRFPDFIIWNPEFEIRDLESSDLEFSDPEFGISKSEI